MLITKCGTKKLCKLKSAVMQQQDVLLSEVNQQLKQVFFCIFPSLVPTISQDFIERKFM
jgi:hypothetical protein